MQAIHQFQDDVVDSLKSNWRTAGKRVIDLIISLILLVPSLPLMVAAMLLVKVSSRGPAMYSQIRVGRGGRTFVIYKIRSMRYNCEKLTGPRWADLGYDPRVTRVGNFLRKSHLDELPQLFNVIRGDMTLVGPRPERPEFVTQLELAIPHYRERLEIRPGVTGLAQILLPPDTDVNSVRTKLSYDLFYLSDPRYILDLKIIFCTVLKIFGISRDVSRNILGVPDHDTIEGTYLTRIERPSRTREVLELQPAF